MAIKPITGVRISAIDIFMTLTDLFQMLRRGLVLDLSVAFGQSSPHDPTAPKLFLQYLLSNALSRTLPANAQPQASDSPADMPGGTVCSPHNLPLRAT